MAGDGDPPRPANLPPGYDEEDPYDGVDLSTFPAWWRRNVEAFRRHEMRPYRPPTFANGELSPPVIERLEAELGVAIRIRAVNPHEEGDWQVCVADEPIATIERTRTADGTARYELTAVEFETLVRDAVEP